MGRVLGIDPGLTGACAVFDNTMINDITVWDLPRLGDEIDIHGFDALIAGILESGSIQACFLEKVGPMPRDGVRQCWRFASANAVIRSVIALRQITMVSVAPTTWKKVFALKSEPRDKPKARQKAMQLFPRQAARFARQKDAGRAEATLIAVYGARETFHGALALTQTAPQLKQEPAPLAADLFGAPCSVEDVVVPIAARGGK